MHLLVLLQNAILQYQIHLLHQYLYLSHHRYQYLLRRKCPRPKQYPLHLSHRELLSL
jgi:hypothetical protein